MAEAALLEVRGLAKSFGAVEVIRGIDAAFEEGKRHLIIGPNGAGKTTFFNLLGGQIPSSSGRIQLFGRDVTDLSVSQRALLGLGRTFQIASLFPHLSIADNLLIAADSPVLTHAEAGDFRERAEEALDLCGLKARRNEHVASLSYGEQRRLEIVMSLVTRPRLLLLDEPMAGLTRDERKTLAQRILDLSASTGIVMIEHDLEIALPMAEKLTVLHLGQIVASGPPEEVIQNPFVRQIYLL
jgi:branched-chain amino acid transport system ATP-binding protein